MSGILPAGGLNLSTSYGFPPYKLDYFSCLCLALGEYGVLVNEFGVGLGFKCFVRIL